MFRSTRSTLDSANKKGAQKPLSRTATLADGHPPAAVRLPITRTEKLRIFAPLRGFVARLIIAATPKVKREPGRAPRAHSLARYDRRSRESPAAGAETT